MTAPRLKRACFLHVTRDRFQQIQPEGSQVESVRDGRDAGRAAGISTSLIGELIMDRLKDLDAVAYVRFASVYREFKDVNTFMTELKKMLDTK